MANRLEILNTIRDNATKYYQNRVPEATRTNAEKIASLLTEDSDLTNEFCTALINRICMQVVHNRTLKNPLAILKKNGTPYGGQIQEIIANPAISKTYSYTSEDLLKKAKPDVKAIYYTINRKDKYSVSIQPDILKQALINDNEFNSMTSMLISTLYSGDTLDETLLMKNLFSTAYKKGHVVKRTFSFNEGNMTADNTKELIKMIKTDSNLMSFASTDFNSYSKVKTVGETDLTTWTPLENQVLIMTASLSANIDVDLLASAFNMNKTEFEGRIVKVDNFNGQPIMCALVDESWVQVHDTLRQTAKFFDPDTLDYKSYYHVWQSLGYSMLANAVFYDYTVTTESGTKEN